LLYGWAALRAGVPFVNFTPSPGAEHPALAELAAAEGVPVAGNDGKTGETLVKTVLAPMFVARNLKLRTWFGYNLLGNEDGEALTDPVRRLSKIRSKDAALTRLVPDPDLRSKVTIDFAPSLHDWKTAWDFIHFEGFLGTRMSLQFCWQGSDSALAAPLVLDLVRFTERSARAGESGPLRHLASFFKSPLGVDETDFHRQFARLLDYAGSASV
jgi:myo-inositol-1-phosphate synthase